jgi:primosomal protein N' (replication factor Y)
VVVAPCPAEALGAPLTDEQALALGELSKALGADAGQVRLVHGVTGSGKTRLYLELVRECLNQGRQAFVLAPEVALAGHLHRAVREAFPGARVTLYHGSLSPSVREAVFRRRSRPTGSPGAWSVGTRSACSLPARTRGLFFPGRGTDAPP